MRTSDPDDSNPKKGTACERGRAGREEASSKVSCRLHLQGRDDWGSSEDESGG